MSKFKEISLKLLYPNIFIFILFFIIGFGSVIAVLIFGLSTHWISYVAYVLSAYALAITVARSIDLFKWVNKKLHSNKYTNRLLTDRDLKNNINVFSGTIFNMIFGIFKFIVGIIYTSLWSGATGIYYLILGLMKLPLAKHILKKSDEGTQIKQYRNTGICLFLLNAIMVIMIIMMLKNGKSANYPGFIIYAQAGYTFYILTIAIINVVKYRKNHTPIIASSKSINLVASIMAMFILQIAMVNQFGDISSMKILNMLSATVVSIATLSIAVYMIINSKKLKLIQKKSEVSVDCPKKMC